MYDWSTATWQTLTKTASFSCCWKDVRLKPTTNWPLMVGTTFQLLLKGCTIEAETVITFKQQTSVSVVVERMYDWSFDNIFVDIELFGFSCCWKDVRLKPSRILHKSTQRIQFQLLLKGCTIEATLTFSSSLYYSLFQLLLKGCTIEARRLYIPRNNAWSFSCCWKDVRLKHTLVVIINEKTVCFSCCWKDVRLKRRSSTRI